MNKALNIKHAANPQVGDFWQEFFHPCFLVLAATPFAVTFLSKTKRVDGDLEWDASHIESCTPKQFERRVSYGSIPGTWCDVTPNWKHTAELIEEAKAALQ